MSEPRYLQIGPRMIALAHIVCVELESRDDVARADDGSGSRGVTLHMTSGEPFHFSRPENAEALRRYFQTQLGRAAVVNLTPTQARRQAR